MTLPTCLISAALIAVAVCAMPAAAADRTTFTLRAFVENDDNVALISDDAFGAEPLSSTGAGLMLGVSRSLHRTSTFELRGSINAFHTRQLNSDAEDFDVAGVVPRISLTKRMSFASRPTTFAASVNLRRDWLGGEAYSRLIDMGGSLQVFVTPAWSIGPSYTISSRDYDDEGFDPEVTSRNALRHTLGFTSQLLLPSPVGARAPTRLSLSASAQRNDADGSDFEFAGVVYGMQLEVPLTARSAAAFSDLGMQLSVSSVDIDYDDFAALPKRSDQRLTASLALSALWNPLGRLDLSYTRFVIDSNRPEYEASRNLLRFGVTYSF